MLSIHSIVRRRGWMSAFMLLIVASLLAACGGSTSTSQPAATVPQVTITAKDFSFAMPDTLQTGLVDITLRNEGTQPHNAQLERLNDGVTQAQVLVAFKKGPGALLRLLSSYGGAHIVDPGQSQEVILNIAQGQYIMLCFASGPDNIPHFIKGMYKFFTVTGPSNANQVSQPQVNGQVMLRDFSIVLPASIPAGPTMLQVTNQGSQPHEMSLLKLSAGKDVPDVLAFLGKPAGPPPFTDAGGMAALAPGFSAWVKLNLVPGKYVALCFVPDPTTGKPHFALGMITWFTVQ
jgi:outer membrane protein assembly factor BamE (lipoprotein component of BamABCDE complex)